MTCLEDLVSSEAFSPDRLNWPRKGRRRQSWSGSSGPGNTRMLTIDRGVLGVSARTAAGRCCMALYSSSVLLWSPWGSRSGLSMCRLWGLSLKRSAYNTSEALPGLMTFFAARETRAASGSACSYEFRV